MYLLISRHALVMMSEDHAINNQEPVSKVRQAFFFLESTSLYFKNVLKIVFKNYDQSIADNNF